MIFIEVLIKEESRIEDGGGRERDAMQKTPT